MKPTPKIIVINYSANVEITITAGLKNNIVQLTYQKEIWGTADLEGIPVGYENQITYFKENGEEIKEINQNIDLSISFGWDELKLLIKYFDNNKQ